MPTPSEVADITRLPNHLIAVCALYELGGDVSRQHSEDVAVRCFKVAPRRFGWKRYPEYPSEVTARVALGDAKKIKYGSLVSGSAKTNWILTRAGVTWSEAHRHLLNATTMSGVSRLRTDDVKALEVLRQHRVFSAWESGGPYPAQALVADSVQLLPDAPHDAVVRRLEELSNAAETAGFSELRGCLTWLMNALSPES